MEAVSSAYETEPVGEILDQPDFLNAAMRVSTELEPEELLDACKAIEAERGRMFAGPRHAPRPLDIDLLLLGNLELETERLRIPHLEVTSRRFVLAPLLELDPELTPARRHPPRRRARRPRPGPDRGARREPVTRAAPARSGNVKLALLSLLACAALAGCGSDDGPTITDPPPELITYTRSGGIAFTVQELEVDRDGTRRSRTSRPASRSRRRSS